MERQPFLTHCFSLVICRHNITGKFLCVKETRNRGWWVAGGLVDPGEDFYKAAIRETKEEAGVDIELKGVLRVEHSVYGHQTARMRVIFYAESDTETPKQISDSESDGAAWFTVQEIQNLEKIKPGIRGPEILEWPIYIENEGSIAPINFFCDELTPVLISEKSKIFSVPNQNSLNAFKQALEDENIALIKNIILQGFDVNKVINQKNWTSLHYSIKTKNEELVKVLLLSGADIRLLTHKQRNAFHLAMQSSFKILKMLLIHISDLEEEHQKEIINFTDLYGDTPLHILVRDVIKYQTGDFSIYNYMVKLGADPYMKNKEGLSPYDYTKKESKIN